VVGLQFFRGEAPEVIDHPKNDLLATNLVKADVAMLLKTACYDCHSSESRFPWYSYIMPFSRFVYKHIEDGRKELNFSDWSSLPLRTQLRKLKDIGKEVEKGAMPLPSYTLIHKDAKLTQEQVASIKAWTDELSDKLMEE
jgi:hypothetical protein